MTPNVLATLLLVPAALAALIDSNFASLRPSRQWLLRLHVGIAVVVVPLLIGVLVPVFQSLPAERTAMAALSLGELGVAYGLLVGIWAVRAALASTSILRR
jgi:hypothetical protein